MICECARKISCLHRWRSFCSTSPVGYDREEIRFILPGVNPNLRASRVYRSLPRMRANFTANLHQSRVRITFSLIRKMVGTPMSCLTIFMVGFMAAVCSIYPLSRVCVRTAPPLVFGAAFVISCGITSVLNCNIGVVISKRQFPQARGCHPSVLQKLKFATVIITWLYNINTQRGNVHGGN